jgi:hypothetical protein
MGKKSWKSKSHCWSVNIKEVIERRLVRELGTEVFWLLVTPKLMEMSGEIDSCRCLPAYVPRSHVILWCSCETLENLGTCLSHFHSVYSLLPLEVSLTRKVWLRT